MALSIEKALHDITYSDDDTQMVGGFIDKFNGLMYQHTKYVGTVSYPPDRQLRMFTMAIKGVTQFATILGIAFTQKWNTETLQAHLRIKEVRLNPHNFNDLNEVVQRRQTRTPPNRDDPLRGVTIKTATTMNFLKSFSYLGLYGRHAEITQTTKSTVNCVLRGKSPRPRLSKRRSLRPMKLG